MIGHVPAQYTVPATFSVACDIPPTISLERAHTLNGHGYVFYLPSPLLIEFLEREAVPGHCLIEIGAGFGNAPIEALRRGVSQYTANDLCAEHLEILLARVDSEKDLGIDGGRLQLLPGRAPAVLPRVNEHYDAILIDKALHFFSPDEIQEFLAWSQCALKKEGRIYVLTISPYISNYRDTVLPIYLIKKQNGIPNPGHVLNADLIRKRTAQSTPHYQVPQDMVFFDLKDLCKLFEENGFQVKKTFSLSLPTEDCPQWRLADPDQSCLVGLIASRR